MWSKYTNWPVLHVITFFELFLTPLASVVCIATRFVPCVVMLNALPYEGVTVG